MDWANRLPFCSIDSSAGAGVAFCRGVGSVSSIATGVRELRCVTILVSGSVA